MSYSRLFAAAALVALSAALGDSQAAEAVTVGFQSASFQNSVTAGSGSSLNSTPVTPSGDAYLNWGIVGGGAQDQSGYVFAGEPSIVLTAVSMPFRIGDFVHRNNPVQAGDSLVSTQLVVDYEIDADGNGSIDATATLAWDVDHNETPNNTTPCPGGDTAPCGDLVALSIAAISDTMTIGGVMYNFSVFGFSNDGLTFDSEFFSDEGANNSTQVWAQFTQVVPEPSTAVLLLAGLSGLGLASRKRRSGTTPHDSGLAQASSAGRSRGSSWKTRSRSGWAGSTGSGSCS